MQMTIVCDAAGALLSFDGVEFWARTLKWTAESSGGSPQMTLEVEVHDWDATLLIEARKGRGEMGKLSDSLVHRLQMVMAAKELKALEDACGVKVCTVTRYLDGTHAQMGEITQDRLKLGLQRIGR